MFLSFLLISFASNNVIAEQLVEEKFSQKELDSHWNLANFFFSQGQYQRSISELYRLKLYYNQDHAILENLLARNYYLIKDYPKLILLTDKQITTRRDSNVFGLAALAYLQVGNLQNAKTYWELADIQQEFYNPQHENLLNPEKAFWLSLFPGAGLAYSGHYGIAIASFLLNSLFFYGIIDALQQEQYAVSYLLFFFEYQFYRGGMRAAREKTEQYNQKILKKEQKIFIQLFEKKFGITHE